ncbi:AraC family transcriptional regulator [Arsenicicoccus piscis]|uniref:Transcriptional regulator n=1 Tax=Arsenicicoccus piscis TaxID=673954 RepID=A0ABQ6HWE2_9MICO|nr:AraC family transcriptional regulator [Arsenicicoccus piscis]GMA21885.1 transcriptional regulator [Arsenicicoccus piscis]
MSTPNGPALSPELRAALPSALLGLMDHLVSTMFCVKDDQGRYVAVNATFVQRTNARSHRDVIGRTAGELFVPELAERYDEQDAQVLATGRSLHHELELIQAPGGPYRWHLTSKAPLVVDGRVAGVVSFSEDVGADAADDPAMAQLSAVVAHIESHLAEPLRVADLAAVAGTSTDTVERRVRRVFHRSPVQLVLSMRIDRARRLLVSTDEPIADIATACGFYDQAAFSRTFARLTGETPAAFRRTRADA